MKDVDLYVCSCKVCVRGVLQLKCSDVVNAALLAQALSLWQLVFEYSNLTGWSSSARSSDLHAH